MNTEEVDAYIALGSNLGESLALVEQAISRLNAHANIKVLATSPWYRSKAVGPGQQPDYINGVCHIQASLSALALLDVMQVIELDLGRVREQRWAARTLDLDLLWFNGENIDHPRLTVPHPRMLERNFVMFPLRDIAPNLPLSNAKKPVSELAKELDNTGIQPL